LNIVMEMGLMESAKQAAIAGGGVTFLSRWAIGPDLEHGTLSVVSVEGFRILRDFYTVRSRTRVLSRAAEALLAYFREQYAEAAPAGPSATIGHASRHATRGPRKGDRCSSS
ncbi:MAG TPA: LysR substrate-binding domain-containing protein, partial [Thermoleophilia bacterium]|nr:LysR substrate-binding domain-containing protein [Thermoleophilia bacterium]HQH22286.1 LysR substrate-binding domain-containing protein [Thermoleophilia bacterium]